MKSNHVDEYVSSGTSPTRKDSRKNSSATQNVLAQPEPLLLDIHGAARALSATPWAVRSLLWDGKIPYVKIGRKFLVSPTDLQAFIAREKGRAA
jgi:excisionase family DNA binding protein